MSCQKLPALIMGVILIALFLVGCAIRTATPTPTVTATPEATVGESAAHLGAVILYTSPFMFLLSLVVLALLLTSWQEQRERIGDLQSVLASLRRENERLKQNLFEEQQDLFRQEWLQHVGHIRYRNEIEVEVKLIYPLAKFLGYRDEDIFLRANVEVQVGRQDVRGQADWVLWGGANDGETRRPAAVIEAKAPTQSLDHTVQAQARSYAFALHAPIYAITNGKQFQVFRRGIERDACLVNVRVRDLVHSWPEIYNAMGVKASPRGD